MMFFLFFVSGFCSLMYQIIWLRIVAANFGVTAVSMSIMLSVFMSGLAIGTAAAGYYAKAFASRGSRFFLLSYAVCEGLIGISGLGVAPLLREGGHLLTDKGGAWGSAGFYVYAGLWIALVILPFTAAMGATLPLALAARRRENNSSSFAHLYTANVLGALVGTCASAFVFIEIFGFSKTLFIGAGLNFMIAALAVLYVRKGKRYQDKPQESQASRPKLVGKALQTQEIYIIFVLLFCSGLSSLGMEVVWTRQFTPYLGTTVYAFAILLIAYLVGTALGSSRYREAAKSGFESRSLIAFVSLMAGATAMFPALGADPRLFEPRVFSGLWVVIFSGMTGFLTPLMIDCVALHSPSRAGFAYAINMLGCIAGPLVVSFMALPFLGEHNALLVLSAPYILVGGYFLLSRQRAKLGFAARTSLAIACLGFCGISVLTVDFEEYFPSSQVRRDFTATVVATGEGMNKQLLVNGYGMTYLTPITKTMVHLPVAFLQKPPTKILVLCFGMGTSFRSATSTGADVRVVELVPSVPTLFSYFHKDAQTILDNPKAHIEIDDARRFLRRTQERYDLIIIDPPPPVPTAASSLLYSEDFYDLVRKHLNNNGILAQWLPRADIATTASVARALAESFPHIRVFRSIENWGHHFLALMAPGFSRCSSVGLSSLTIGGT